MRNLPIASTAVNDCWALNDRDASTGRLAPDPAEFPDGIAGTDKPLASGEHAITLHNPTGTLATVGVAASDTGLPRASAYRLGDVWTGAVTQTRGTIEAAVPAHGTVVYKVRPAGDPRGMRRR